MMSPVIIAVTIERPQYHLITMDDADRHAVLSLAESIAPIDRDAFELVLSAMRCASHEPGDLDHLGG